MTIKAFSKMLFLVASVLLTAIVLLALALGKAHEDLIRLEGSRLRSFRLVDQLRQSCDDSTKFARSYVATGDTNHLGYYRDILAIRNGTKPRPQGYFRIYWDFVAANAAEHAQGQATEAISLRALMSKVGLSAAEEAKLDEAEREIAALLRLDERAFHAMEGRFEDGEGGYTRLGPPDRALAIRLLHDAAYHEQRAKSLRPVDEFVGLLEARTTPEVLGAVVRVQRIQTAILALVAILFALVLLAGRKVLKRVSNPIAGLRNQTQQVGLDLEELARVATAIAQGDLGTPYATRAEPARSTAKDEIGELSREQDSMIGNLKVAAGAITRIVADLGSRAEELKAATQDQIANRQKVEIILNSVTEGIHGLDLRGNITFENEAASKMFGSPVSQLLGRPGHDTIHHSHADGRPYPVEKCPIYSTLRDGKVHRVEGEVFWRSDGSCFPVEYSSNPLLGASGEVLGAVVVFRDLTERNRREASVRESERRFRCLVTATSQIVWWTDADGQVAGPLATW